MLCHRYALFIDLPDTPRVYNLVKCIPGARWQGRGRGKTRTGAFASVCGAYKNACDRVAFTYGISSCVFPAQANFRSNLPRWRRRPYDTLREVQRASVLVATRTKYDLATCMHIAIFRFAIATPHLRLYACVCVCVQCACRRSDLMVYNTPYVHCCCIHILLYCCSCNIIMYVIDFIIITIITHEFEISVPARSAIKWRDVMRHEYEIMLFAGPYKWPLYFIRVPYYSRILGILYAHSTKRTSLSVMGAPPPNLT